MTDSFSRGLSLVALGLFAFSAFLLADGHFAPGVIVLGLATCLLSADKGGRNGTEKTDKEEKEP